MENKRIDFNLIIGFLLIGLLLWLMSTSMNNSLVDEETGDSTDYQELTDDKNQNTLGGESADNQTLDFNIEENNQNVSNDLDFPVPFENNLDTLSNDKVQLIFSNYCGCFIETSLIEKDSDNTYKYEYNKGEPVKLINESKNSFPLKFYPDKDNPNYSQFELKEDSIIINNQIIYEHKSSGLQLTYTLDETNKLNLKINNLDKDGLTINWNIKGPRQEKNLNSGWSSERTQSYLYYAHSDGDLDYISESESNDFESEENVSWIAYKQQFFSTILFSKNENFWAKDLSVFYEEGDTSYVKQMNSELVFEKQKDSTEFLSLDFYFLANDFSHLKSFDTGESASFNNLVDIGWGIFGWVNQYFVQPVFDLLESLGLGYGLIILSIAIIFKMLLFFPTKKSYVSMAKMRVLKPEIDALNERYKDKEPMEKQRAQMELYKKTGVSPLGGCLPMLFQIPILFALFKFFPSSIQLRREGFLWASDLSTYDTWPFGEFGLIPGWFDHLSLFALLMSISTLVQMRFNSQPSNSQMPQLKYIMYIMPVVFFFIMNSYSAGLSYYYLCANIMTFLQQLYIKRNLNDEKLYAQLQENKKKPIKKSGFQKRLEEMQRKQQARRRK